MDTGRRYRHAISARQPSRFAHSRRAEKAIMIEQLAGGHSVQARLHCRDGSSQPVLLTSNAHGGAVAHGPQQSLTAIVKSSDDAIVGKNLQGIVLRWHRGAERIFGYTASEVIGKHVSMLAVPERVDEILNIYQRISRGDRVEHYITQRRTKDGRVLWVSLTVSPPCSRSYCNVNIAPNSARRRTLS